METPFGEVLARARHYLNVALFFGVLALILASLTDLRHVLERVGLDQERLLILVVGAGLLVVFNRQGQIESRLEKLAAPKREVVIEGAVPEAFPYVREALKTIQSMDHKTLDILALNCNEVWTSLSLWLEHAESTGWKIRIFTMSPEFIRRESAVPDTWATFSELTCREISRFCTQTQDLAFRGIGVKLFSYELFPAVHGFRLGNGAIFLAITRWLETDHMASAPIDDHSFFLEFPPDNHSQLAIEARKLFDSWMRKVEASAKEVP